MMVKPSCKVRFLGIYNYIYIIYSHFFARELYLYVLAMHVSNDNLIVNRHQHIHTLLRDCTCLYTSYINHVPRIVI